MELTVISKIDIRQVITSVLSTKMSTELVCVGDGGNIRRHPEEVIHLLILRIHKLLELLNFLSFSVTPAHEGSCISCWKPCPLYPKNNRKQLLKFKQRSHKT